LFGDDVVSDDTDTELSADDEESVLEELTDEVVLDDGVVDLVDSENVLENVSAQVQVAEKSFFDKVMGVFSNGIWGILAALGAVILGFLGLLFYRKHKADEEFEVSMLSIETQSSSTLASENSTGYASIDSLSDHPVTEMSKSMNADTESSEEGEAAAGGSLDEPTKETSFLTVYSDSDAVVQADEVDPIAEADVYIAYGRDEQAEEVLKDGISNFPDRPDIKHKLLGLYHKNDNKEEFERLAEELYADKDNLETSMWRDIAEMGKQILPANPLFELSEGMLDSTEDGVIDVASEPIDEDSSESDDDSLSFDSVSLEETSEINLTNFDEQDNAELSALDQVEFDEVEINQDDDTLSLDEADDSESDSLEIDLDDEEELIDFDSIEADSHAISVHEVDQDDISSEEESVGSFTSDVSDLDIDADHDEARTQYELAKVFVDLGDVDGATKILNEIVENKDNDDGLVAEANELLESIKA